MSTLEPSLIAIINAFIYIKLYYIKITNVSVTDNCHHD